MKVFVIGLDGLDYNHVKRWNMKGFMQKFYGKHYVKVAVKRGEPLYTPLLWTAFLTGFPAYIHGMEIKKVLMEREKAAWGKLYPLFKLRTLIPVKNLSLRWLMIKLGLRKVDFSYQEVKGLEKMPENARSVTFLEEAKRMGYKTWSKEIPAYNDEKIAAYRMNISQLYYKPIKERLKGIKHVFKSVRELWEESLYALTHYDLVMFYSPLPDFAHHMFPTKRLRHRLILHKMYKMLENMVKTAPNNIAKIIVSDHGFDDRNFTHSDYGFWSSNVSLPEEPKTIIDFKKIILRLLEEER